MANLTPNLQHLCDEHGLEPDALGELIERYEVEQWIIDELLEIALVTHRHTDLWGMGAEYERAIKAVFGEAVDDP